MCLEPITIKRKVANKFTYTLVPCGHCPECVRKAQNGIMIRSIEECRKRGNMCFLTLTYSDANVPKVEFTDDDSGECLLVNSLRRSDVAVWKRNVRADYRRKFGKNFPEFGFLFCGEYGPRTLRPHYHGLIYGLDTFHLNYLEKYWTDNFGFAVFLPISSVGSDAERVSRYVSKYCVKPPSVQHPLINSGVIEKPRLVTSIGFGLPDNFDRMSNYILDGSSLSDCHSINDLKKILSRMHYVYNGKRYSLPQYLTKKLLYENGLSKTLVSSPLKRVLSTFKRVCDSENSYRELQQLVSGNSEREAFEAISSFLDYQETDLQNRRFLATKVVESSYKSSKF